MGIMFTEAVQFAKLIKQYDIHGRCLSFGRQVIWFDIKRCIQLLVATGHMELKENGDLFPLHPATAENVIRMLEQDDYKTKLKAYPHYIDLDWIKADWVDDAFLQAGFGFETYHTLDATTYEHCDVLYDLNCANIKDSIAEPYDLVMDTGTMEHVFLTQNYLKNIFDSLKVGGYVIHCSPTNNHIDHGFFQFSPTLFHDYYRANKYELIDIRLFGREKDYANATHFARDIPYSFGCLDDVAFGGFDDRLYTTFVLARKTAHSTWDAIPQQGVYNENIWDGKELMS